MLIYARRLRGSLLLIMSVINEDVLWLEPLVFLEHNSTLIDTTLGYQWQPSASSMSLVNNSTSIVTAAAALRSSHHLAVLKWSVRIIGGLLITVGGIGNTLSALTLSRKKLRAQVTSIYLIALALSDLGRLRPMTCASHSYDCLGNVFFSVLNFYLIRLNPSRNMRLHSDFSCKFHMFFTYYFINLSPTLLVAVSVQRYLAVAKHHYSKRHCTVKNAYFVIGLICFVSLCIQIHWSVFYELTLVPGKPASAVNRTVIVYRRVCNISSNYPRYLWFRSRMLGYIQWFFFTLCPFVIMLVLNCSILKVIASASRIQQRMNQKNQRKKAKQRNMTIMLLSVSCVFISLTAPASTFMAFGHLVKNLHGPHSQSLWTMFSLIYYANTAANFLLYFLTANVFRQELRVMLLTLPGCSKFITVPNPNLGRTQQTTMPLMQHTDEEKTNGTRRKSSGPHGLTVTVNQRLLNRKVSHDDHSRL